MAALSPAHFLLWTRLTTASRAPSVTPSKEQIWKWAVGVSSSTSLKHYLSAAFFLGQLETKYWRPCMLECIHLCVSFQPFVSRALLSWQVLCLYHFLCFCHFQSHCCIIRLASSRLPSLLPSIYQVSKYKYKLKEMGTWNTTGNGDYKA